MNRNPPAPIPPVAIQATPAFALCSIEQCLTDTGKCRPGDLAVLHITLRPRDDQTLACKLPEYGELKEIFRRLCYAQDLALEYPRFESEAQDLVAECLVEILQKCGFFLRPEYSTGELGVSLAFDMPFDWYTLATKYPMSSCRGLSLGQIEICPVYIPQCRGVSCCDICARELFTLVALAGRSRVQRPGQQSYPVRVFSIWNHEQYRVLTAEVPESFLMKLESTLGELGLEDGFEIGASPFFDPVDLKGWEMANALLREGSGEPAEAAA
ncbi:MAG: hypothetical protein M1839_006350 [Geoglossum umbratile]|nr:MAG: hypothetical protein M1839_006350 [Geoglossum umbratile]